MRVLVMSPEDFTKARRGEFLSRIVTEDFDLVICAHTSFGFIEPGRCAQEFIGREVEKLRSYLQEMRRNHADEKRSLKQIEQKIAAFETKLMEYQYAIKRDSAKTISWDELGIDALFVDESQEFKNLSVATMMQVAGVPKGDAKRAFDMRIKTCDILQRGGKVVFATGTPILNSIGEAFVLQTFLAEELLAARGIDMFDAWARTFAEIVPVFEMTPDGGGFRVNSRLARFANIADLFQIWFQFTFSRSREQLGLPTPTLMGEKRIGVSVPASNRLKAYVTTCVERVEAIKQGKVQPWQDNILKIASDASKAALDTRLVLGGVAEDIVLEEVEEIETAEGLTSE
jgi:N12 class adenine-specific DNA methylase